MHTLTAKLEMLSNARIFAAFLLIAGLLYLPFLVSGFAYDDFFWVTILEEDLPYRWWIGFWDVEAAKLPAFHALWYADTENPGRFLRPLFSAVFAGAFTLFGRESTLVLHVISTTLHAIAAFLVFLNAREFLKPLPSLSAGLMFLICPHHVMTVGWISTATDLLSSVFILACVYACLVCLRTNSVPAFLLGFALFATGLFAKESSIAGALVMPLAAYFRTESVRAFRRSAWCWAPASVLAGVYLVFYAAAGFGTQNAMYSNPFTDPFSFAQTAVTRTGILLLGSTTIVPAGLTLFYPNVQPWAAAAGFLLTALLGGLAAPLHRLPAMRFALASFSVSLLPQLAVDASERQLYLPFAFAAIALSILLFQAPSLSTSGGIHMLHGWRARLVMAHAAFHFAAGALVLSIAYAFSYPQSFALPEARVRQVLSIAAEGDRIVLVNSPGPFFTFYAPDIMRFSGGPQVRFLAGMSGRVWCKRDGRFIYVKTDRPGWLTNMFARLARKSVHVEKGAVFRTQALTASILDVAQGDVRLARFEFHDNLEGTVFIAFENGSFRRILSTDSDWILAGDTSDPLQDLM
jgi:hypothetical protein